MILGGDVAVCLHLSVHRAVIFAISQLSCYVTHGANYTNTYIVSYCVVFALVSFTAGDDAEADAAVANPTTSDDDDVVESELQLLDADDTAASRSPGASPTSNS